MISKLQSGVFNYLSGLIHDYGIPIEFKYDQDMDLINEFRRSYNTRIHNKTPQDSILDTYPSNNTKYMTSIGVFSRSPIKKDPNRYNNIQLQLVSGSSEGKVKIRDFFSGTVTFEINLLFDSNDISDIIELFYTNNLSLKSKEIHVDYHLNDNEDLEDVPYTLSFSELNNVGSINKSNLRQLSFSIDLTGLFFSSFYIEDSLIKDIVLSTHVYDKSSNIDKDDYRKLVSDSRAYSQKYVVDESTRLAKLTETNETTDITDIIKY